MEGKRAGVLGGIMYNGARRLGGYSLSILRDICPSDSHPGGMKFLSTKEPSVSNYAMPVVI